MRQQQIRIVEWVLSLGPEEQTKYLSSLSQDARDHLSILVAKYEQNLEGSNDPWKS